MYQMLALILCTVSMFQGLPEQERQQLTEQLALKEKEKVSTHIHASFFLYVHVVVYPQS